MSWEAWENAAKIAPLGTGIIAVGAFIVAIISIRVQRRIALKRATIDFLFKTEMDPSLIEAWEKFNSALDVVEKSKAEKVLKQEKYKAHNAAIVTYLGIMELVAIGIRERAFDERVMRAVWWLIFTSGFERARDYITSLRTNDEEPEYLIESERLYEKWKKRREPNSTVQPQASGQSVPSRRRSLSRPSGRTTPARR